MRLVLSNCAYTALGIALFISSTQGFTSHFSRGTFPTQNTNIKGSLTQLDAKKKKGGKQLVADFDFDALDDDEPMSKKDQLKAQKAAAKAAKKKAKEAAAAPKVDPKAAALAALDNLDFDDEPMSAKEKAKMEKKKSKEAKKAAKQAQEATATATATPPGKKDRKAAALKALEEMERIEAQMASDAAGAGAADDNVDEFGMPKKKLSKKELKALKKKEEKMAAKKAAKEAKKAAKRAADGDVDAADAVPDLVEANGEAVTPVSVIHLFLIFQASQF